MELLPQPWRDWTSDAARLAGAPADYVAQAVLASVAAVAGRRVVVLPTPGWQESLRLWLAAVGMPSSGKSPALEPVRRVLWMLEDASPSAGGASPRRIMLGEGPFERLADRLRRDPRGMVLWRDDVLACLAPPAGARSVRQLEPYGVSIMGTVAPAGVERAQRADPDSAARTALLQPLGRLLHAFDALEEPHGLFFDEPAARAFEAFRARLHEERRQADGIAGGIEAAWLGKGGGAAACLAGVFALMSWAASDAEKIPGLVDLESVERAVSLWWDYYRPHALALFGQGGPSEESQARRVVRWLRASGREIISRKDVRRSALSEAVDAREADDVIACLVEAGARRPRPRVPTDRAGRPALRWDVNPLLTHLPPCATARGGGRVIADGGVMSPSDDAHDPSDAVGRRHLPNCVGEESEGPRPNRQNRPNPQTH